MGSDLEGQLIFRLAIAILMEEHRVIERVLRALELATEQLEQGGKVDPGFFIDATDFIRGFADGCHHRKEEGVLFRAMIAAGMPSREGPIAVMQDEHQQARDYTRGLYEAAQRLQAGDEQALTEVVRTARGYATLLRQHIAKEDNILFPMAATVIPRSEQAKVAADFAQLQHDETCVGVHEKYLALAIALEGRAGG